MTKPADSRARLLQGNRACALGAIAGGCRFYAGYPITPSSEVAEWMSRDLPACDGVFVQMEDEIASMGAVLGASMGGVKSMTATSGPGFSLMQEHLGFSAQAEVPCVIVNVMRGGPGTGLPTRPSQADVMQARWGAHGDHPVIVLAPASVSEIYMETIRAFNLAEAYRVPVVVLYDEVVAHLRERVVLPEPGELKIVDRKLAHDDVRTHEPYAQTEDWIPPMARYGDGYRTHTTGLTHAEDGFPTQIPATVERVNRRLLGKLDRHRESIDSVRTLHCEDAEVIVVTYGITARAAQSAVKLARQQGIKAGLFRPVTMWPFPEAQLREVTSGARAVLVPEMNYGQLVSEVERVCRRVDRVIRMNRYDGETISPAQVLIALSEAVRNG